VRDGGNPEGRKNAFREGKRITSKNVELTDGGATRNGTKPGFRLSSYRCGPETKKRKRFRKARAESGSRKVHTSRK